MSLTLTRQQLSNDLAKNLKDINIQIERGSSTYNRTLGSNFEWNSLFLNDPMNKLRNDSVQFNFEDNRP